MWSTVSTVLCPGFLLQIVASKHIGHTLEAPGDEGILRKGHFRPDAGCLQVYKKRIGVVLLVNVSPTGHVIHSHLFVVACLPTVWKLQLALLASVGAGSRGRQCVVA